MLFTFIAQGQKYSFVHNSMTRGTTLSDKERVGPSYLKKLGRKMNVLWLSSDIYLKCIQFHHALRQEHTFFPNAIIV